MKVVVLTTSYPRFAGDAAGSFVSDTVDAARARGVQTDVVSPASFRHFGIAYGHGVVNNLREAPWKALLVPLFLASFVRAARAAARDADLVHAHWIPSGLIALTTGKPYVLHVWGTDVELARHVPALARPVVSRARLVLAGSEALAAAATQLGAREVRIVRSGVKLPEEVGRPADPPHVLFCGRLSAEKGILEFVAATEGLPRVIVGDGPLRPEVPAAVGFVPRDELGSYYERAAVVCCPSHREGYGMVAREAMAHGRPVVATSVGGLADAIEDGVTGLLVQPRDVAGLREALTRLLEDAALRERLGLAARLFAERAFSRERVADDLFEAYRSVGAP